LRPWWPAVAFTLLIGLVRPPIVHAQSSAATPSHEAREVLTRIEKELSERLAYVSRPEQIPGEFRSLWGSKLETLEGFQDWYYFFLPYAIRVADAEVDALEDLQDEVEKLRSNLETTPDALNAALDLSNAVSWTGGGRPESSYIPPKEWSEWILENVPLKEEVWKAAIEFTRVREVEEQWMEQLQAALETGNTDAAETQRALTALREKNQYIFNWGKNQRLAYLFRQYEALKDEAEVATVRANWQASTARKTYEAPYRREGIFEIIGSGAQQGVRRTDTREVILPRAYEIWQIAEPVILGRDRDVLVWNLRGQLLGASTAAVDVDFGNDLNALHIYADNELREKRFVYVPERGALLRFARLDQNRESLDEGIAAIDYLVVDEEGLPVGQGSGFWRFQDQ
jgi:hypothetical protein